MKANASPSRQAQHEIRSYFFPVGIKPSRVEHENKAHPHTNLSQVLNHPHNCNQSDKFNSGGTQAIINRNKLEDQYQPVHFVNTQKTSPKPNQDAIKTGKSQ